MYRKVAAQCLLHHNWTDLPLDGVDGARHHPDKEIVVDRNWHRNVFEPQDRSVTEGVNADGFHEVTSIWLSNARHMN